MAHRIYLLSRIHSQVWTGQAAQALERSHIPLIFRVLSPWPSWLSLISAEGRGSSAVASVNIVEQSFIKLQKIKVQREFSRRIRLAANFDTSSLRKSHPFYFDSIQKI